MFHEEASGSPHVKGGDWVNPVALEFLPSVATFRPDGDGEKQVISTNRFLDNPMVRLV